MQQFSLAFSGFPCFLCCKISRKSLVIQTNIHPLLATHTLFYISPAGSLTPCRISLFPPGCKVPSPGLPASGRILSASRQSLNLGIHPVTFFRNDIVAAAVLVARRSFSRSQQSTSISFFISGFFRFLLGFVGFFHGLCSSIIFRFESRFRLFGAASPGARWRVIFQNSLYHLQSCLYNEPS